MSGTMVGSGRADIDDERRAAGSPDAGRQIGQFLALGVGGADHVDALHRRSLAQLPIQTVNSALHFCETRVSY